MAFGTSARSPVLTDWPGWPFIGSTAPTSRPHRRRCLAPLHSPAQRTIRKLARELPVGTPIRIRYLPERRATDVGGVGARSTGPSSGGRSISNHTGRGRAADEIPTVLEVARKRHRPAWGLVQRAALRTRMFIDFRHRAHVPLRGQDRDTATRLPRGRAPRRLRRRRDHGSAGSARSPSGTPWGAPPSFRESHDWRHGPIPATT